MLRDWRVNEIQRRHNVRLYSIPRCDLFALWPRLSYAIKRQEGDVVYRDIRDALGIMAMESGSFWEALARDSRSNAHGFGAYAGVLLFEAMAGIKPGPGGGYRHCLVEPLIDETLNWARGHITVAEGVIGVAWSRTTDRFEMTVGLPDGVQATVRLPALAAAILARGGHSNSGKAIELKKSARIVVSLGEGLSVN